MPSPNKPLDIWQAVSKSETQQPFALVALLDSEGSTPAKIGSRAIVDSVGRIVTGTIGGGALEGFAQRTAIEAIRDGKPSVFDFSLQGVGPPVADPICGGKLRVLVDPRTTQHRAAYALAAQAREQRRRGVLLTTISVAADVSRTPQSLTDPCALELKSKVGRSVLAEPGRDRASAQSSAKTLRPAKVTVQWIDESALSSFSGFPERETLHDILRREASEFCVQENSSTDERLEVLVEAIVPKPRLLIVGGGHVGQAIALQASIVGFDIAVMDDRAEFTRPELFPEGTRTLTGDIPQTVAAFPHADDTYIALVTRGHKCDAEALEACLRKPHAYLGMIGSKRKVVLVKKAFLESGRATTEEWEKLYTPIGLDIGALTVPEIATSIVAQLIAVRRKGSAPGMPK